MLQPNDVRPKGPATPFLVAAAVSTVLSIGLSYAAQAIFRRKPKQPFDSTQTALSNRGSYVPLVMGRRRIAPLFCWTGSRVRDDDQYFEAGWHALCLGPAYALHGIYQNGKQILTTTLTPGTHPSGTSVTLSSNRGTFRIYWGECDQPIDTYLGAQVGASSRWPHVCYVVWQRKRLGFTAQWPQLEYDIEVRPAEETLSTASYIAPTTAGNPVDGTTVWYNGGASLAAGTYTLTYINGALKYDGTSPWRLHQANTADRWRIVNASGATIKLCPGNNIGYTTQGALETANAGVNTTFVWAGGKLGLRFYDSKYSDNVAGSPNPTYRLTLGGSTWDATGVVTPTNAQLQGTADEGINPAVFIWNLLTAKYPHGRGLPMSALDTAAFEAVAAELATERLPVNVLVRDGQDASEVLDDILQVIGVVLCQAGDKITVKRVREGETPVTLNADLLDETQPEVSRLRGDINADSVSFYIADRQQNYRNFEVALDDDAVSRELGRINDRQIELPHVTDRRTATIVAQRRFLELTTDTQTVRFRAGRTRRRLLPGAVVSHPTLGTLRVSSVQLKSHEQAPEFLAVLDVYSLAAPSYTPTFVDPDLVEENAPLEADAQVGLFVVPAALNADTPRLGVVRCRVGTNDGVKVLLSTDGGATYFDFGSFTAYHVGGTLNSTLLNTDPTDMDYGPSITAVNDDVLTTLNLVGNDVAYDAGTQLLLIGSELMFVRRLEAVSGGFRLRGIRRARYGTTAATHAVNAKVFVFQSAITLKSAAVASGNTLLVKTIPYVGSEIKDVNDIAPVSITIP